MIIALQYITILSASLIFIFTERKTVNLFRVKYPKNILKKITIAITLIACTTCLILNLTAGIILIALLIAYLSLISFFQKQFVFISALTLLFISIVHFTNAC